MYVRGLNLTVCYTILGRLGAGWSGGRVRLEVRRRETTGETKENLN